MQRSVCDSARVMAAEVVPMRLKALKVQWKSAGCKWLPLAVTEGDRTGPLRFFGFRDQSMAIYLLHCAAAVFHRTSAAEVVPIQPCNFSEALEVGWMQVA